MQPDDPSLAVICAIMRNAAARDIRLILEPSDKNSRKKMKQLHAFAWPLAMLLCLAALQAPAQYRVAGRITDRGTGKAIPGASIRLDGKIALGTTASDSGTFLLTRVPGGNYRLEVSSIGYRTQSRALVVTGNTTGLATALEQAGLMVKPLEVIATRAGKEAPFTETTLSEQDISKKNLGRDLPYLLRDQPSVTVTSDAGAGVGYTGIWIRGSDLTRINVTFNGIPVNDAESAGTYWVDIPAIASSAESIQVERGVGTSTNGAGAFGATINLSTNEFHSTPYGMLSTSAGSFHTWKHEVKAGSGLLHGHFTVDARLSDVSSDGYIDRASSDLKSFYFSTAYFGAKTSVRFNLFSGKEKTYQAWDGVPEDSLKTHRTYNDLGLMPDGSYYKNQTDNYTQTYYQLFLNQQLNEQWNFSVAAFLTRGKGYYEEYKMDQPYESYGLPDPVVGGDSLFSTDLIRDLWLDNYFYGTVFSLNHTGKRLNWHFGGGWDRYDGKHYGDVVWARYAIDKDYRYYDNMAHKSDLNLYWKADKALGTRLRGFLDVQYRHIGYDIRGFDDNPSLFQDNRYDFFNPKAGLSYALSAGARAYISYAVASKEPNRDDFDANQTETPGAEHMGDLEAGYDLGTQDAHLHANLYYMHYHDQLVLTGKINDVGAYTRTNIPRSYRLGVELSADKRFAHIWTISANAAFSRNKIRDFTEYIDDYDDGGQKAVAHGQTDISFSPAAVAGAALSAEPLKSLVLTLRGKYVSRRYLDNTSQKSRSLDPYLTNSLEAHYTWTPRWISAIVFHAMIDNLFNVRYLTNGYTYTYIENGKEVTENAYFPQAGINFLAGIDVSF